jgi:TRAP transporter 4TM/12TM fusion protein
MTEQRKLTAAVYVIAAAFSTFHLWTSYFGTLPTLQQVYIHLGFALVLIFMTRPALAGENRSALRGALRWAIDAPLCVVSAIVAAYLVINFMEIAERGAGDPTAVSIALGVAATLLVLEATRRMVGWALPLLSIFFLVYGFAGPWFPGSLAHRGFDLERIAATLYLTDSGIAGTPLQVSATYVSIFVIFAAFLDVSGVGRFFIDWSYAALGWMRGGPAKVAIFASAMMGTVSGSAVANVVATGTFTIPVMKRAGLRPAFAGAVEAAASSGGQIMPPVMGAAAFIMVEMLGTSYNSIMSAAALPAVLYFTAILAMVDFEVAKEGIRGLPRAELPSPWGIFRERWHLVLPLVVLVYLLVWVQYTPIKSAFLALVAVVLVSMIRRVTRMGFSQIAEGLRAGGMSMLEVAAACACAGIIIGVMMISGLALRLSSLLVDFSGGSLMVLLFLTMIVSLILGMGLPTSAVYVVLAALVVPAMIDMGVQPLSAHMFVFYFGVLANVTPPVAIAAYAGAGLAGAKATTTGFIAFRLALAGFILPFMWVYNPALLLNGTLVEVLIAVCTGLLGIVALAGGVQGYLFGKARWHERLLLGIGAIALIKPGLTTDLVGVALLGLAMLSRAMLTREPIMPAQQPAVSGAQAGE